MIKYSNIWLIGTEVNSFPCHGKDRQFKSGMSRLPLVRNGKMAELVKIWLTQQTVNLSSVGSSPTFRPITNISNLIKTRLFFS